MMYAISRLFYYVAITAAVLIMPILLLGRALAYLGNAVHATAVTVAQVPLFLICLALTPLGIFAWSIAFGLALAQEADAEQALSGIILIWIGGAIFGGRLRQWFLRLYGSVARFEKFPFEVPPLMPPLPDPPEPPARVMPRAREDSARPPEPEEVRQAERPHTPPPPPPEPPKEATQEARRPRTQSTTDAYAEKVPPHLQRILRKGKKPPS